MFTHVYLRNETFTFYILFSHFFRIFFFFFHVEWDFIFMRLHDHENSIWNPQGGCDEIAIVIVMVVVGVRVN